VREPERGRVVALKLFAFDLPGDLAQQLVVAFERLIAAELLHPAIATPIAAGASDAGVYLVQEYVTAESFDHALREYGPAPHGEALRVAAQLAGALDFASAVGVHHGALHPRDVLLAPQETCLTGLGIVQAFQQIGRTAPLRFPYVAPERASGSAWDRRADIFSLAALTYELLSGHRWAGIGPHIRDHFEDARLTSVAELQPVFARALAPDPAQRFATALEFVDALRGAFAAAVAGEQPGAAIGHALKEASPRAPATRVEYTREAGRLSMMERAQREKDLRAEAPREEKDAHPVADVAPPTKDGPTTRDREPGPTEPAPASDPEAAKGPVDTLLSPSAGSSVLSPRSAQPGPLSSHSPQPLQPEQDSRSEPASGPVPPLPARPLPVSPLDALPIARPDLDIRKAAADDDLPLRVPAPSGEPGTPPDTPASHRRRRSDRSNKSTDSPATATASVLGIAGGPMPAAQSNSGDAGPSAAAAAAPVAFAADADSIETSPPARSDAATLPLTPDRSALILSRPRPRTNRVAMMLMLVIGVAAGFLIGYFVRPRTLPAAFVAEPVAPSKTRAAAPAAESAAPPGREFTESAVPDSSKPADAAARDADAARPKPEATAANIGRVLVRSTPAGANVFVDGRDAGVTPVAVRDLAPGAHRIRIVLDGYAPAEERIVVTASRPAQSIIGPLAAARAVASLGSQSRTPAPSTPATMGRFTGILLVESRPAGARVFLDNTPVGTTPLVLNTVRAGEHAVRMERDGYRRWSSLVRVVANERNRITASLER
jgi:eukaryotic-like serine/threonine-protein kinase